MELRIKKNQALHKIKNKMPATIKKGRIIMETAKIAQQMIGFQKTVFDNSFKAMAIVQDQTEDMINNFMGQFPWITEDAKKQMNETYNYTKKARDDFKKAVDDGYAQFEKMLNKK